MDSVAFDRFWATVAPLSMPSNASFVPPHYPTYFTVTQPIHLSTIPRDNIFRQFVSLWFITVISSPKHSDFLVLMAVLVDIRRDPVLHIRHALILPHL
jgi:hypothetical protein